MRSLHRIASLGFRGIARTATAVVGVAVAAGEVLAQAPAAPAPPGAPGALPPAPAAPVAGQAGIMEWGIVVLMVGLAVFVVCKSSHRN